MIEKSDKMALEALVNESLNFDTKCDNDMTQQLSGVHSYMHRIKRISDEEVSRNVTSSGKPPSEC